MIKASHKKWANWVFRPYVQYIMAQQFHRIELVTPLPEIRKDAPLLLLPNHSTWWDGFFVYWLNKQVWQRPVYLMVLKETLLKFPFFRHLGAFSIDPASLSATRESLIYSQNIVHSQPSPVLCLFPQGKLMPWGKRPLEYKPGIQWLIKNSPKNLQIILLAIKIEFGTEQRPTVYLCLQKIKNIEQGLILPDKHAELLTRLDNLIQDEELQTQTLFVGKKTAGS